MLLCLLYSLKWDDNPVSSSPLGVKENVSMGLEQASKVLVWAHSSLVLTLNEWIQREYKYMSPQSFLSLFLEISSNISFSYK